MDDFLRGYSSMGDDLRGYSSMDEYLSHVFERVSDEYIALCQANTMEKQVPGIFICVLAHEKQMVNSF